MPQVTIQVSFRESEDAPASTVAGSIDFELQEFNDVWKQLQDLSTRALRKALDMNKARKGHTVRALNPGEPS